MNANIKELWSRTTIVVWPEELVLASFDVADAPKIFASEGFRREGFCSVIIERDEVSVTCSRPALERLSTGVAARAQAGPYRAITLDLPIDLGVCGYLLPAVSRLADAGISIVPQCAYLKDHLVIRSGDIPLAVDVLQSLVDEAQR